MKAGSPVIIVKNKTKQTNHEAPRVLNVCDNGAISNDSLYLPLNSPACPTLLTSVPLPHTTHIVSTILNTGAKKTLLKQRSDLITSLLKP